MKMRFVAIVLVVVAGLAGYAVFRAKADAAPVCRYELPYHMESLTEVANPEVLSWFSVPNVRSEAKLRWFPVAHDSASTLWKVTSRSQVTSQMNHKERESLEALGTGSVYLRMAGDGTFLEWFRAAEAAPQTADGIRALLQTFQHVWRKGDYPVSEKDLQGIAVSRYHADGDLLVKKRESYEQFHPTSPSIRIVSSEFRWEQGAGKLRMTGQEATEQLIDGTNWLISTQSVQWESLDRVELTSVEQASCQSQTPEGFAERNKLVHLPDGFEGAARPRVAKHSAKLEKLVGNLKAPSKDKMVELDHLAQLTARLDADPQSASAIVREIRASVDNHAVVSSLIGALAGSSTAEAQAALREVIEWLSTQPRYSGLWEQTIQAQHFSPKPSAQNLDLLWATHRNSAAPAAVRTAALFALATNVSVLEAQGTASSYLDQVLNTWTTARTDAERTTSLSAIANLGDEAALPMLEKLAVEGSQWSAEAVESMRLIPGKEVEQKLIGFAAKPALRPKALEALAHRVLHADSLQALTKLYKGLSSEPASQSSILVALSEPRNRETAEVKDFLAELTQRGLQEHERQAMHP